MKRKKVRKLIAIIALSAMLTSNFNLATNVVSANPVAKNEETSDGYLKVGGVASYTTEDNKVTLEMTTGESIRVSLLDHSVLRIYMDPQGEFQEDPTPNGPTHVTTIRAKEDSDYVGVTANVVDGDIIKISTDNIELRIEKATGKMELFNKKTNTVLWKETEALKYNDEGTIQTLETDDSEYFYGGGMQNGRFSHKGEAINIVNENNWVDGGVASPTPFYFSTNGYGAMRNTFKPGRYDFAAKTENTVTTRHNEERFDAYYFIDDTIGGILDGFYELTGDPLLMPEYAFYLGHLNCYARDWVNDETGAESQTPAPGHDRQETLMVDGKQVLDSYINNDLPLGYFMPNDGYGCGYGRAGSIDGNIELLKQFADYADDNGVQTGLWTQSQLTPSGTGDINLQRDIAKEVGIAGSNAVKTDVAWVGAGYSFALNSVRQASEGIENNSIDNARPYVVAVDGWAGTQRYSTIWSGDQSGGVWEYIRFHIPTYIGASLSGNPNIGSDMDGIFGGTQPIIQTRDYQWKAFTPIQLDMDGWGRNDKTPHVFGEPYTSINRMYLKLKSEMMPYVYSIANEAVNDKPMVRAMMLEYPNEYTYGKDTQYQYMWGENMLVAPIYQDTAADSEGNDIRNDIYLPDEDQIWIDYFTGEHYEGGGVLNNFDAPVWKVPVFVKNGAIIPMVNENNTPEDIDNSTRKYEVYPSGNTSFEVYEDDGLTTDYKDGKSATTLLTSSAPKTGEGTAVINAGLLEGDYDGIVTERETEFVVNVSEKPEELSVTVGDTNVELTEATSLEEYEAGTNMYFYDETPNLNKYSEEGSEFAEVEITTTPKLYVNVEATDVTVNEVELTIEDFINTQDTNIELNPNLEAPANLEAPEETVKPTTITLLWDEVEGATSYDIYVDGMVYKNITDTEYTKIGLEFDTTYTYRVRSVNEDGYSEWSEAIEVTTKLDPYTNVPKDMEAIWPYGQYGTGSPDKAVDGDDSTMFHSAADALNKPFIVDMKKSYEIEFLDLLFRAGGNGSVRRAEVYSSVDGINYEKVFDNTIDYGTIWATDGKAKRITFDEPIDARYFKIIAKEASGNFVAINEIKPVKVVGDNGQIVGDWNNDGQIEEGDLTFLTNYAGVNTVDADWEYVSAADLNENGLIDAYDIAYVTNQIYDGTTNEDEKIQGEINTISSSKSVEAGEEFTIDVMAVEVENMNSFSVEIPIDSEKYDFVSIEATEATADMDNFSRLRVHTDGTQDAYVIFNNGGENTEISGTEKLATVTLRAKVDTTVYAGHTHALLVDNNLNSRDSADPYRNTPENMTAIWDLGNEMQFFPQNAVDSDDDTRFMYAQRDGVDKEFVIDMNGEYNLERVDILSRDVDLGSGMGGVLRAEIYTSLDGENYELAYSNAEETGLPAWVNEGEYNVAEFEEIIAARYIKLVAKETQGGYLSYKEIRPVEEAKSIVVTEPEYVFTEHLEIAIEEAELITEEELVDVVPAVVEEFKAALLEAKELLVSEDITQEKVEESFNRLSEAMQMLEFIKGDKTQLERFITTVDGLESDKFITETWTNLATVLEAARAVMDNENALEAEVSESYTALVRAFLELRLKPSKDALNELINEATMLEASDYTVETWNALRTVVDEAIRVSENEDATEEDINEAETNLEDAIDNLEEAEKDDTEDNNEAGDNNGSDDNNTGTEGENGSEDNDGDSEEDNENNEGTEGEDNEGTEGETESGDNNEETEEENEAGDTNQGSDNSDSENNTELEDDKDKLPQTGGTSSIVLAVGAIVLAGAGFILYKKKGNKEEAK